MNMNMRNWLNFTFFSMVLLSSVRAIAGPGENWSYDHPDRPTKRH